MSIFTGDQVELDEVELSDQPERGTAVVTARLPRRNLLTHPNVANVDQVFIVQAIKQPEWNALLCDRYLVHLQLDLPDISTFVIVNKCDLASEEEIQALRNIYESIGYKMFFISAKDGRGVEELRAHLAGKTSVLTGPSGVGKSSLLNALNPSLNLRVDVKEELLVGRHTTTASELYKIPEDESKGLHPGWVVDTPGFSLAELRHPEPAEVAWQFPELAHYAPECRFGDCLHLIEAGCKVLEHLDKIPEARYASYRTLVAEAQQEQRLRKETSQKVETGVVKYVHGKEGRGKAIPKLSTRYRAASKRRERQNLSDFEEEHGEDEEELDED